MLLPDSVSNLSGLVCAITLLAVSPDLFSFLVTHIAGAVG